MKNPDKMTLQELIEINETIQATLRTRLAPVLEQGEQRLAALRQIVNGGGSAISATIEKMGRLALPAAPAVTRIEKAAAQAKLRTLKQTNPNWRTVEEAKASGLAPGKTFVNGARYRNPKNHDETWTGVGKRPGWFAVNVARGILPAKMEIPGSSPPARRVYVHPETGETFLPGGHAKHSTPKWVTEARKNGTAESLMRFVEQGGSPSPKAQAPAAPEKLSEPGASAGPLFVNPENEKQRWNGEGTRPAWFGKCVRAGMTLSELNRGGPVLTRRGQAVSEDQARRVLAHRGVASVARYRNPLDAEQTWTGGGTLPGWMQAQLVAGRNPSDFLIEGCAPAKRKDFDDLAALRRKIANGDIGGTDGMKAAAALIEAAARRIPTAHVGGIGHAMQEAASR